VPKDTKMTYFKHVTNHTEGKPDPTKYFRPLSWKTSAGNFGLGGKRKTFTDEAQVLSKKTPGPTTYAPPFKPRILFGKISKTEGVDYLSDCQYIGKCYPGPGSYSAVNFKITEKKAPVISIAPDRSTHKGWKPVKSKNPDCGSYNPANSMDKLAKKTQSVFFLKPGSKPGKEKSEKVTFTTEFTRMKKFVPGTGTYEPKLSSVSIPYLRKRC